jgi:hypothetical protein
LKVDVQVSLCGGRLRRLDEIRAQINADDLGATSSHTARCPAGAGGHVKNTLAGPRG